MFTLASGLANSPLGLILIYAVIIGVFWWFLMRPQKKEAEETCTAAFRTGSWRYCSYNKRILWCDH